MAKSKAKERKPASAIAKAQPAAMVNLSQENIPAHLRRAPGTPAAGLENVGQSEMTLPRLGLCQSMTPQRKKEDPSYIQGLEEGQFFNTITGRIYGEKVNLVPLLFFRSRILFRDMEEGGGILCRSLDAIAGSGEPGGNCSACPLQRFTNNEKPDCTLFYNYAAVVIPPSGDITPENLLVVSLKSTGLKVARDWNALMRLRGIDAYGGVYEFSSGIQRSDNKSWYQPIIRNAGFVENPHAFAVAQSLYHMVCEAQQQGRLSHEVDASEQVAENDEIQM